MEHWQPADATDLFKERWRSTRITRRRCSGWRWSRPTASQARPAESGGEGAEGDPKLVEAHELLARVALEDNNPEKAETEAKKALDQSRPKRWTRWRFWLPSTGWTTSQTRSGSIARLKINPMYGEAYATAGHFFVINRRYDEGIKAYRKALEIEAGSVERASRAGRQPDALRPGGRSPAGCWKQCFNAGYQSTGMKNSLKLLDSYKNYETFTTPTTVLRLDKKEAALLRPYFQAELDRAIATYEKKYKFNRHVRCSSRSIPNHEDFAVRTMGMPGLGALGVTFGNFVAMDSPSGRKPGSFIGPARMWHELSHVYVLAMTNIACRAGSPKAWRCMKRPARASRIGAIAWIRQRSCAIKDKKLLPIADLDRGFIHPPIRRR